jgi:hypothetical protein
MHRRELCFSAATRRRLILAVLLMAALFGTVTTASAATAERDYDVIVVGAGAGGTAAALQAARSGARVALLEETNVVGGQMTAAAVSTMDDMYANWSGIYEEFLAKVKAHYDALGKSTGTCYWVPFTIAFEPSVGEAALLSLFEETRSGAALRDRTPRTLDLFLRSSVIQVLKDRQDTTVTGVLANLDGTPTLLRCKVLVDATEYGDVLPLAGAAYRAGNAETPFLDLDARIQDITWVAVMKAYPRGIPEHLRMSTPPPGYEERVELFRSYLTRDGNRFWGYPVKLPVNFHSHNAYRGLPDSSAPGNADASTAYSWLLLSKTGVNWCNDYPGKPGYEGRSGLPVRYFEDGAFRRETNARALLKTLQFLYYVQNELGLSWSVADDEFDSPANLEIVRGIVPEEYAPLVRRFPPMPYVRESRRLVGLETLTSTELRRNSESYLAGRPGFEQPTSLAVGRYILDLHGSSETEALEARFGETAESTAENKPRGPFQVPFEIFIPEKVDGLVAAEKNLSMTRLTSGALRLQPICMFTGQAAGAIAAAAVRGGIPPRKVNPLLVQRSLLEAGSVLALLRYSDVPRNHPYWAAVQLATVRELLEPRAYPTAPAPRLDDLNTLLATAKKGRLQGIFGVDEPLAPAEAVRLLARVAALGERAPQPFRPVASARFVTRSEFVRALAELFDLSADTPEVPTPLYGDVPAGSRLDKALRGLDALGALTGVEGGTAFRPEAPLSRGLAVDLVYRVLGAEALWFGNGHNEGPER